MFGKKKEENPEYIGDYYDNLPETEDYDEALARIHRENTSTGALNEVFQPYVKMNEQILCVIGYGRNNSVESKDVSKGRLFIAIGSILCALGFVFAFALYFLPAMIWIILFSVGIVMVISGMILFLAASGPADYAITDRRILALSNGLCDSIRFEDIECTSIREGNGNTGKLILYLKAYNGDDSANYMIISKVNNPQRVKNILDDARLKYWKNKKEVK